MWLVDAGFAATGSDVWTERRLISAVEVGRARRAASDAVMEASRASTGVRSNPDLGLVPEKAFSTPLAGFNRAGASVRKDPERNTAWLSSWPLKATSAGFTSRAT